MWPPPTSGQFAAAAARRIPDHNRLLLLPRPPERPPQETTVGTGRDAAFLVHAFNSCRFFAFWERAFFTTPYYHGDIRHVSALPCSIELTRDGEVVFRAEMQRAASAASSPNREPSRSGDDAWAGPIFLPRTRSGKAGKNSQGKVFFGKLQDRRLI